ncbi:hypothetical protein HALLA_00435 (plasmid) [Halostagnicola larsenii XH-48]|uniref:Uncharacterized protein n=1 Tax=Halostagnicola larsenii XH-48 TaxID=797299 RepID=W0JX57_9EURY|nr:hypothetical protein HALLA_00435 [Halostagnicola larsenii XH-48]
MSNNPFDDLDSDDDGIDTKSETESESAPESSSPTQTSTQSTEPQTPSAEPKSPSDAGPGFEYSEVRQKPLYARDKTWDELEDKLGIQVTPELRRMEIRDEETREVHDAILKVALDHIDEVPDQIHKTREESLE